MKNMGTHKSNKTLFFVPIMKSCIIVLEINSCIPSVLTWSLANILRIKIYIKKGLQHWFYNEKTVKNNVSHDYLPI